MAWLVQRPDETLRKGTKHSPFHASNKAKLALLGKAFFVEACGAIDSLASDRTSADTHLAGKNKKVGIVQSE
jgi:hypothetical protein